MAPTLSSLSVWSVPLLFHNTIGQTYYIVLSSHQEKQTGMWSCLLVPPKGYLHHSYDAQLAAQHIATRDFDHSFYLVHLCDSLANVNLCL